MKVQLLQTDIVWGSPAENRDRVAEMAVGAGGGDLFVLPEMFTTGFTMSPFSLPAAERDGRLTLEWMVALARGLDAAVAGSVAIEERGQFRNRLFFVRPDGTFVHYDKRHLFTFAGEHEAYTAGNERIIVEWRGVRVLLQICYDLRFPVFARNRLSGGRADYDMILYVASWPQSRIAVWDTLLRARAIENVCYVAGVNRVGADPREHGGADIRPVLGGDVSAPPKISGVGVCRGGEGAHYPGHSALIDFRGEVISRPDVPVGNGTLTAAPEGREAAVSGYLDIPELTAFRAKFPALADADGFEVKR